MRGKVQGKTQKNCQRVFGNNYFHRVIQSIITYYHYIMEKIVQDTQTRQINSIVVVMDSMISLALATEKLFDCIFANMLAEK